MDEQTPNTTTVPSDPTIKSEPLSASTDKPSQPRPNPTALQKLRLYLLRRILSAAHSADRNIVRLSKLLSTPSGIDVLLCTTSYTLTLIHAILSRILERKLANIATDIAEKADGILLPGETLVASLPAPASTKLIAQVVGSSKALADVIADYRIFVRLWGTVGLYTWARGTYNDPLPADATTKDKAVRGLTWAAIASCIAFQVLENGAYLSSKGVLTNASWQGTAGKAKETQWWLWSCRFWALYVGCELARLGVERVYRTPSVVAKDDGEKEDKLKKEEMIKAEKMQNWLWWKDLASNLAYAPMTIHWSVEQGILADWGVGACGIVAGGSNLAAAWMKTA